MLNCRRRIWTLRELRRHGGFSENELLKMWYTTPWSIRPVVEYSSVIYHPMLTTEQSKDLERLQARALKNIYGYVYSHKKLLELSQLRTLEEERSIEACLKFAMKTANHPRFSSWFPMRRTGTRRGNERTWICQKRMQELIEEWALHYFTTVGYKWSY